MPANKYFNHHRNQRENSLIDNLSAESIRVAGLNAIYLVREGYVDLFHGEDPTAKFGKWFELAAHIKDGEGFQGTAMQKLWGITMEQFITIQISKKEFVDAVGGEMDPNRPREGDLLYFPYGIPGQYLLEIKFVTDNSPFDQLGLSYVYELKCRMFTYSQEGIKTGLNDIDQIENVVKQEIEVDVATPGFVLNEVVFQGASFATSQFKAILKKIDGNTLTLGNVNGNLDESLVLNGNTSAHTSPIGSVDLLDIKNDVQAQNRLIQNKSDSALIKNPRNPFDKGRI